MLDRFLEYLLDPLIDTGVEIFLVDRQRGFIVEFGRCGATVQLSLQLLVRSADIFPGLFEILRVEREIVTFQEIANLEHGRPLAVDL